MSFTVGGISSGLDTNAIVDGLMFAERATVRRLEKSKALEAASLSAWSDIGSKLSSVASAVTAISTGDALGAAIATSSDEDIARVTSTGSPVLGVHTLLINSLAAAKQETSNALASGADLVGAGTVTVSGNFASFDAKVDSHTLNDGTYVLNVLDVDTGASTVTVNFDGVNQTVTLGGGETFTVVAADGGTLQVSGAPGGAGLTTGTASITVIVADASTTVNNVISSLNAGGGPVRAQLVDVGDAGTTPYRMIITSSQTGLDAAFLEDFTNFSLFFPAGLTNIVAASDADIDLGGVGGINITRPTNSISDLIDGLTIDLVGTSGSSINIIVGADSDARVAAVTTVVDSVTAIIAALNKYSSYDVEGEKGGVLVGSFSARSAQREIREAMSTLAATSSFVILGQIGITIGTDGTYSIDETVLRDAVDTNPGGVEQVLLGDATDPDDGVFDVVKNVVDALIDVDGRVPTAKDAAQDSIDALEILIELQEVRLVHVEDRIRRQFTVLEQLIGQLNSQGGFLTSVLSAQRNS